MVCKPVWNYPVIAGTDIVKPSPEAWLMDRSQEDPAGKKNN